MPANYDKLKGLLRELFQMDQADLDFGIFRIMNAKRDEIERFLEHDLLPQVQEELARHIRADGGVKRVELEEATEKAKAIGVDPDMVPRVLELREQVKQGTGLAALENEVFSHLYNFFRRYYDQGDFLSLRRYKEGVYAIPYEGEEVKLYWANHDQYYIKSSEYLRNYAFKLADGRRVHFKVAEADTEADNNKPQAGKERRFILADSDPVSVTEGELIIRFEYRTIDRKQAELNAEAVTAVLGDSKVGAWRMALAEGRPTEKNKQRTLLEKHLSDFTAKNTFDYFIHKDLGGFLRRELDFFIKNEIMHLDDVEDEAAPKVELYLSKIKALRKIAHKVIAFLDQLETFQKKLWLKKKFVVETNYCVTLDRVPEELYPEILSNSEQVAEWKRLFLVQEIRGTVDPEKGSELAFEGPRRTVPFSEPPSVEFLKENQSLVLDTRFFSPAFTLKLISAQANLDSSVDGILIHGDNFHALSLLRARFQGEVKSIYIDPPYNTGTDEFLYKDNYQHSSWLAAIDSRLGLAVSALKPTGNISVSLDVVESSKFDLLVKTKFRSLTKLGEFVWKTRNTDNRVGTNLSVDHDYIHTFGRSGTPLLGRVIDRSNFKNQDNDPRGPYTTDPLTGKANAEARPNLHYTIINPETGDEYPPDPDFGWITDKAGFEELLHAKLIYWPKNPKSGKPRKKRFLTDADERAPISSLGISISQGEGNIGLADIMGSKVMNFPKPVSVVRTVIDASSASGDLILDFYAGSGTTGHAVVELNRQDGGNRRFILVEAGAHFDTVLLPRLMRVIYSADWAEGRPVSRAGSSQFLKYVRLESYDDSLLNLTIRRTQEQEDLLARPSGFREDYLLKYALDVETRGSASLLNVQKFADPFSYKLKVSTGMVGETKEVNVDLVETFNWLIGLKVKQIDHIRNVRVVEGTNPQGDRVLILWRNVAEVPNDKLDEWFNTQGYNTRDQEYDLIYVNGDNNLENLRREDQTWKVRLIEEDFHKLMWDCQDV